MPNDEDKWTKDYTTNERSEYQLEALFEQPILSYQPRTPSKPETTITASSPNRYANIFTSQSPIPGLVAIHAIFASGEEGRHRGVWLLFAAKKKRP